MLRELTIDRFRAFEHFEIKGLGRINLLVGTNNGGKTSVLEAIHLLAAAGDPAALISILDRRGEMLWNEVVEEIEGDASHLFYGHEMAIGSRFSISGLGATRENLLGEIIEEQDTDRGDDQTEFSMGELEPFGVGKPWALSVRWRGSKNGERVYRLSSRSGLSERPPRRYSRRRVEEQPPVHFVGTSSLDVEEVVALFEQIVLTPEESLLVEALQTIEPRIERIASVLYRGSTFVAGDRGGLFIKCAGIPHRIPIGSMGEGIWRLLGVTLALIHARGGILLIDEIDTGLHYSVMADLWKLVSRTAARLDVQVFATTHSRDCYESLAAISRDSVSEGSEVSIQRIEKAATEAVAFSEREIVITAERGIEVR